MKTQDPVYTTAVWYSVILGCLLFA